MIKRVVNLGSLNTFVNPLLKKDGDLIRCVNCDSHPYGAKSKRPGYNTFLGTANGSAVNTLFSWTKNDGTTMFVYRASGSALYHSVQGTGAWTLCGNGTIGAGKHVGYAVLDDVLIIGDGVGSTRYSSNGTAFTDATLAPVAEHFAQYQNRIYAGGTSSTLFYSTLGSADNWDTTLDGAIKSDSLTIPGAGKINKTFVSSDRLISSKNSGIMYKWDGYALIDMATHLGPTSPYSVDEIEGYNFWLNREGVFGYGGERPQILSNAIQNQIYNNAGNGIAGTTFNTAPGEVHRYNYYCAVGTVTDDLTTEQLPDAVIKYDFQKNEFLNYRYNDFPTAFHSYKDANGDEQLIFGGSGGQVMQISGTATSDNGVAIESVQEYVLHLDAPETEKKWDEIWAFFNPGCKAKIQVAMSNTFAREDLDWVDIADFSGGVARHRFPQGSRSRLLFVKIYESSKTKGFTFYGFAVDASAIGVRSEQA